MTASQSKRHMAAVRLHNRGALSQSAGDPVRPEKLYIKALQMKEDILGPEHPELALTLNNLGLYYKSMGRLGAARPFYARALAILEKTLGSSHPDVGTACFNLAQLHKAEAAALEQRADWIQEAAAEVNNPEQMAKAVIHRELARYRLSARPSRIHRFGVFCEEPIPSGEPVIQYTGERVSRRVGARRCGQNRTYTVKLDSYWRLDGTVGGSGAELINHCCEPNCAFGAQEQAVWVLSLRTIQAGEELLLDYRLPKDAWIAPCYCGASTCRGTINLQ